MATAPLSAFRALRPLSIIVTGGALLYIASDGGDEQVLRTRTRHLATRIDKSLVETVGEERYTSMRSAVDKVISYKPEADKPETEKPVPEPLAVETIALQHQQQQQQQKDTPPRRGSAFCHTCSGPRLWYFADKFRIKRRIGPYPDPSLDGEQ